MITLKRHGQGIWYPWPKNEGVRFKIRPLTSKKLLELRNESKQGKVAVEMPMEDPENPGQNLIKIVDDYNDLLYEQKMLDYCLEDWEGLTLEDGIDKETPEEEIKRAIQEAIFDHVEMRRFIFVQAFKSMAIEGKKFQDELKNLESSQDGS